MQITRPNERELTSPLVFLRGEFSLWNYRIPYFSSVVSLSFAIDKLSLIEDIPQFERMEWSIEELFQRDISWNRIQRELLEYLRNEQQPQFFNSITVALLPQEDSGFAVNYVERFDYPPIEDSSLDTPIQVGGIQLQSYKGSDGLAGQLRWDPHEIRGIAVDGQHRLAAIRELKKYVKLNKLNSSHVPVIFLVPSSKVNFYAPELDDPNRSLIGPLRRIFIDLNKNARPVSRTRNILLDDQDIRSVCTRRVISSRLSSDEDNNRIPLPLIDWASETNKFEQGPFITTVLLLNDIITTFLHVPKEIKSEDDISISNWLQSTFKPTPAWHRALMSRVAECYKKEVPLTFLPDEITYLGKQFEHNWTPFFRQIFAQITPYNEIWNYEYNNNMLNPEIVNLYIADIINEKNEEVRQITNVIEYHSPGWSKEKDFHNHLSHINNYIKKGSWAFKVVFQKALFKSYFQLMNQYRCFTDDREQPYQIFTNLFIEAINDFFNKKLGNVEYKFSSHKANFWRGVVLRPDDSIDHTQQATNRFRRWLCAWICMYHTSEIPQYNELTSYNNGILNLLKNQLHPKTKEVYENFSRLAKAKDETLDDTEAYEEAINLIESRYEHLRSLLTTTTT